MNLPLDLNADLPEYSEQDWLDLLAASARSRVSGSGVSGSTSSAGDTAKAAAATVLQKLTTTTLDGIEIAPLYRRRNETDNKTAGTNPVSGPGEFPYRRGTQYADEHVAWDIRQIYRESNVECANRYILEELQNGVTSLHLQIHSAGHHNAGIPLASKADFEGLLENVLVDLATVSFEAGSTAPELAALLFEFASNRQVSDTALLGAINFDPLTNYAHQQSSVTPAADEQHAEKLQEHGREQAGKLAKTIATQYPGMTSLAVNTRPWHLGGASAGQELGIAMAAGVEYLRWLSDSGLSIDEASQQIIFQFAVDCDYFASAAKLRAARELWARVCQCCDSQSKGKLRMHAFTSQRMLSTIEPDVNQLRNTVACAAAALGGADIISVEPHLPGDEPDELTRRIARNLQLVLMEESQLHRVNDALGGSGYIESLTDELVIKGWEQLQKIESAGGALAAIHQGQIAETVKTSAAKRHELLATRKQPLVGVTEYAAVTAEAEPMPSCSASEMVFHNLPACRDSARFEQLRTRTASIKSANNKQVFLATLGLPSDYQARAGFSRNLLAIANIQCLSTEIKQPEDQAFAPLVAAFRESGSKAAVICSSDALYQEHAVACCGALRAAGADYVVLAGAPSTLDDRSNTQKFDDHFFMHCNVVEKLDALLDALGAPTSDNAATAQGNPERTP